MIITERRLRSIIRNVIRESMNDDDESYSDDDSIYAPFDDELEGDAGLEVHDDMEVIDADDIPQLDRPAPQRGGRRDYDHSGETRRFMSTNRRVGAERDRGSYATRGSIHSSQLDMLDDMGEIGHYDEDDYDY